MTTTANPKLEKQTNYLKVFCKYLHMVSFLASMVWPAGHVRRYFPKILTASLK
jgi:hypothetical protein